MKPNVSAIAFGLFCLPLMAQLSAPKVGTARYQDGSLHTVQGLPDNMIVADLPLGAAEAVSFSDGGGLVLQNGAINLLGADFSPVAQYPTSEKALLSMDGEASSALAWLPVSHTLLHWSGTGFVPYTIAEADLDGTVTDLQSSGAKQAQLIVVHGDQSVSNVTVSLRTGNLVTSEPVPGAHGHTFGQGSFVIYVNGKELVADNLHGYRRSVAIPAADVVQERMSNNWLHLYSPSLRQNWALHLTQAHLQLSLLPGLPEGTKTSTVASSAVREMK